MDHPGHKHLRAMLSESHAHHSEFPALFEAELAYVVRTLRRLAVPERDLPDLAQEVFVAVHRRFAEYDRTRPVRPWLFAFAYRIAQNHRRLVRHDREALGAEMESFASDRAPDPHATAETAERRELLMRALATIPFDRRVVLVMHDLDARSAPEIAKVVGAPVNTVYARLRIARGELERAVRALGRRR